MDRCCFDFLLSGIATNTPERWTISRALSTSVSGPKGEKLMSIEKAYGLLKIAPGEERFIAQQGASYHIDFRNGTDGVIVTAPLYDEIPVIAAVPASGPRLSTS
jgi:hypothetical protein